MSNDGFSEVEIERKHRDVRHAFNGALPPEQEIEDVPAKIHARCNRCEKKESFRPAGRGELGGFFVIFGREEAELTCGCGNTGTVSLRAN